MMKKQSITKIILTILISMMGANVFAADIAVKNSDNVTIFYDECTRPCVIFQYK